MTIEAQSSLNFWDPLVWNYHLHRKPGNLGVKSNGTYHSIGPFQKLWAIVLISALFPVIFFQLILVHSLIYPFCVWTSCSFEYLHLKCPPGWILY